MALKNEEPISTKKGNFPQKIKDSSFGAKIKIFPPNLKSAPLIEASPVGGFQQPSRRTPGRRRGATLRSTRERGSALVETCRRVPRRVAVVRVVTGLLQDGDLLGIPRLQYRYAARLRLRRSAVVPVRTSRRGVSPVWLKKKLLQNLMCASYTL